MDNQSVVLSSKNQNQETIEAYNKHVKTYIKNTPQSYLAHQRPMLVWIDHSLGLIQKHGKILEIGSATPRDAKYMRAKGHFVQCSDGAKGFVEYLKERGEEALHLNILTDPITAFYDLIFANGVVQHFSKEELTLVLKKVFLALKPGSFFVFSAKEGDGEEWVYEKLIYKRYVRYWQPYELADLVEACGFRIAFLETNAPGDLPNHRWIRVTAQR